MSQYHDSEDLKALGEFKKLAPAEFQKWDIRDGRPGVAPIAMPSGSRRAGGSVGRT